MAGLNYWTLPTLHAGCVGPLPRNTLRKCPEEDFSRGGGGISPGGLRFLLQWGGEISPGGGGEISPGGGMRFLAGGGGVRFLPGG